MSLNDISSTTQNLLTGKITVKKEVPVIKHYCKPNLTKIQGAVLNKLRADPDIIIKPADKGGATVVLSRLLYHKEVLRQLNNREYYEAIPTPRYPIAAARITAILERFKWQLYITPKQFKYPGTSIFSPKSINPTSSGPTHGAPGPPDSSGCKHRIFAHLRVHRLLFTTPLHSPSSLHEGYVQFRT